MSYPRQYLGEIFRRYIQKREIDSCMQKIQLQLPDIVKLPPVDMSAQKFKVSYEFINHILGGRGGKFPRQFFYAVLIRQEIFSHFS